MKKKILFTFIIILPFLQSCNIDGDENHIRTIPKPIFEKQISLSADSIEIKDVTIEVCNWKINNNQVIILSEVNRDNFLYVFTIQDFSLLYKYGTYGQGPSEFIAANWLNMNNENQLGLYDIPNLKMYTYRLSEDTLQLENTFNFKIWERNLCRPYTFIQQINDSLFLLKADMREYTEIELVNINNNEILQTFRNLMKRKPQTIFTTYYFEMAANSNNLALAYHYIDRIELFRFNDSIQTMEPSLIIGSNKDQSDTDFDSYVEYYTALHCGDKYIYALHQQGQSMTGEKNSIIEIYTLNGEAVKKIILDRYISTFVLDSQTNRIYGTSSRQDFDFVYYYKLPE